MNISIEKYNELRKQALTDVVETATEGKYVYLDTRFTMDNGYETMGFPASSPDANQPDSWGELYCLTRRYDSFEEAEKGHKEVIEEIKTKEYQELEELFW
jgi:hypothetical protein